MAVELAQTQNKGGIVVLAVVGVGILIAGVCIFVDRQDSVAEVDWYVDPGVPLPPSKIKHTPNIFMTDESIAKIKPGLPITRAMDILGPRATYTEHQIIPDKEYPRRTTMTWIDAATNRKLVVNALSESLKTGTLVTSTEMTTASNRELTQKAFEDLSVGFTTYEQAYRTFGPPTSVVTKIIEGKFLDQRPKLVATWEDPVELCKMVVVFSTVKTDRFDVYRSGIAKGHKRSTVEAKWAKNLRDHLNNPR